MSMPTSSKAANTALFFFAIAAVIMQSSVYAEDSESITKLNTLYLNSKPTINISTAKAEFIHIVIDTPVSSDSELDSDRLQETMLSIDQFERYINTVINPRSNKPIVLSEIQAESDTFLTRIHPDYPQHINISIALLKITQDGAEIKNENVYPQNRIVRKAASNSFIEYHSSSKLATIQDAENARVRGDIYSVPNLIKPRRDLKSEILGQLRPESGTHNDPIVKMSSEFLDLEYDTSLNYVLRETIRDESTGEIAYVNLYGPPRDFGSGLSAPTFSVAAHFETAANNEQSLYDSEIFIPLSIVVNEEISPEDLWVSVPSDTTISNVTTTATSRLWTLKTKESIDDVASVQFPGASFRPENAIPLPDKKKIDYMPIILMNLAAVVGLCCFIFWKKSNKTI